jgi:peptide methionine sulfoxide reductase msrA/msrB
VVRVHVFNKQGQLVGPLETARVELSDDEWQRRLNPEQFQILRSKGTERPFCGTLLDNKQQGVYTCAGCGLPLFSSDSKFNSGTGWPSFFQPVAGPNIEEQSDLSFGRRRTEIMCARCGGHLGHVFDDGPRPTGLRYCLNSESLNFTPSTNLASLADPIADQAGLASTVPAKSTATAVFAGGCFWCTEAAFEQLDGVLDVESGYAGGKKETAKYQRVCDGDTGHAEAIRITYDPARISFDRLLDVFFDAHDPTQLNRQGNDVGTQYRSAIFVANDKEEQAVRAKIDQLNKSGTFSRPIVTTIEPLKEFFSAEDYHQDYARHHPNEPYIRSHAVAQVCKVRDKHPDLVRGPKS